MAVPPAWLGTIVAVSCDVLAYKFLWLEQYKATDALKREVGLETEGAADKAITDAIMHAAVQYVDVNTPEGAALEMPVGIARDRLRNRVCAFVNEQRTIQTLRKIARRDTALDQYEQFEKTALYCTVWICFAAIVLPWFTAGLLAYFEVKQGTWLDVMLPAVALLPFTGHIWLCRAADRLKAIVRKPLVPDEAP